MQLRTINPAIKVSTYIANKQLYKKSPPLPVKNNTFAGCWYALCRFLKSFHKTRQSFIVQCHVLTSLNHPKMLQRILDRFFLFLRTLWLPSLFVPYKEVLSLASLPQNNCGSKLRLRIRSSSLKKFCLCGSLFPLCLRTLCSPIADSYRMDSVSLLSSSLRSSTEGLLSQY